MANFIYNHAKHITGTGSIDFSIDGAGSTGSFRVALVMTNTTVDTEDDVATVSAFTTLDEYDGTNYPGTRPFLANPSYDKDAANNRSELTADATTFTALGAGTRQAQAALVILQVGASPNDANDVPLAYIDQGGFPFDGTGADITINWDAEGVIQVGGPGNP